MAEPEVVQPRLVVHPVSELREEEEILRAQVQPIAGAAEIEAAVRGKLALCILAPMARAVGRPRDDLEDEWGFRRAR